ncbi:MAG: asparagine synthase (glutamine-hydrolyzing) [bacterium]|jgi:asparagine synthase (glutamine-hydrolysing)
MCGIAGFFGQHIGFPKNDSEFLNSLEPLKRRGPDNQSIWRKDNVSLGHTRLSIIDLTEEANQPFIREDLGLTIVFNGEIFNYVELREELKKNGYQFQSSSDTEVILCAWHLWGVSALHKFNGMWAFGIYNQLNDSLTLCRDRFGIKPLYYFLADKAICFASETNWFHQFKNLGVCVDSNLEQLENDKPYSLEGNGLTIYKNLKQILPGHILTITNNKVNYYRWYNIFDHIKAKSFNTQTFLGLLQDSIKLRLRSDVPVATALSGGLDSSSIYALVLKELRQNHQKEFETNSKAFTVSFPGTDQDESKNAKKLVDELAGNWENIALKNGIGKVENKIIYKHFDAVGREKVTAIYKIYEAMHFAGYKVSLDGHGVDEMLFGYIGNVLSCFEYALENDSIKNAKMFGQVLTGMSEKYSLNYVDKRIEWKRVEEARIKSRIIKWLPKRTKYFYIELADGFNMKKFRVDSYYDQILFQEFFIKTLPTLLRNFDKASMYSSVEVRMPFMDYRLVEYCFSLNWKDKIKSGFSKYPLRNVMKGILPESTRINKIKIGVGTPNK